MSLYKTHKKPVVEEKLTDHLSVGLFDDGKVMTMIHGVPFVQCRGAVITAPNEDALAERIGEYRNMDEFLAARSKAERALDERVSGRHPGQVSPEAEFFVHKSNLEAWVENGYALDIVDSRIAYPILAELSKYDETAKNAFYYEVERRWVEGNDRTRIALTRNDAVLPVIHDIERANCFATGTTRYAWTISESYRKEKDPEKREKLKACIDRYVKGLGNPPWWIAPMAELRDGLLDGSLLASMKVVVSAIESGTATVNDLEIAANSPYISDEMKVKEAAAWKSAVSKKPAWASLSRDEKLRVEDAAPDRGDRRVVRHYGLTEEGMDTFARLMPRFENGKASLAEVVKLAKLYFIDRKRRARMVRYMAARDPRIDALFKFLQAKNPGLGREAFLDGLIPLYTDYFDDGMSGLYKVLKDDEATTDAREFVKSDVTYMLDNMAPSGIDFFENETGTYGIRFIIKASKTKTGKELVDYAADVLWDTSKYDAGLIEGPEKAEHSRMALKRDGAIRSIRESHYPALLFDILIKIIDVSPGMDVYIDRFIRKIGRGEIISTHDGKERKVDYKGTAYFIYQMD